MAVADRRDRWASVSGLVLVVSLVALFFGYFVPANELPVDAGAAQIADYYLERGAGGFLIMYALIGMTGAALLWFAWSLHASLRRIESTPARLSTAAFAGGMASAILFLAGGAALLAPFSAVVFDSRAALDPGLYSVASAMGFTAIDFGLIAASVMIVATSLVTLQFRGFPAWFGWSGFVAAMALALNILYFFGLFVWVGWVLLASILLLRSHAVSTPLST